MSSTLTASEIWGIARMQGGSFVCGIVLAITCAALYKYGISFNIFNDKKRQILLNLICILCSVNAFVSYGFGETKVSSVMIDFHSVITFSCVQWALVILNHNSIVRFSAMLQSLKFDRKKLNYYCCVLYVLPFLALTPIFMALSEMRGTGKTANSSYYNTQIFKPLNIALLIVTEIIASITDVLLLHKVGQVRAKLTKTTSTKAQRLMDMTSRDLHWGYALTWFVMVLDIAMKIGRITGMPTMFDSMMTIWTVALRSRINLQYGLELQKMFSPVNNGTGTSTSSVLSQQTASTTSV